MQHGQRPEEDVRSLGAGVIGSGVCTKKPCIKSSLDPQSEGVVSPSLGLCDFHGHLPGAASWDRRLSLQR